MIEARITNEENPRLDFGTQVNKEKARQFFVKNAGKTVRIESVDRPSLNKRKFFEGAIVPYWFYQHPHSGWKDYSEARENLKLGCNVQYIHSRAGDLVPIPGSTKMNKERFDEFLEKVTDTFIQNGLEFPDSEHYKAWIESVPDVGDEFPPLKALRDTYLSEKNGA